MWGKKQQHYFDEDNFLRLTFDTGGQKLNFSPFLGCDRGLTNVVVRCTNNNQYWDITDNESKANAIVNDSNILSDIISLDICGELDVAPYISASIHDDITEYLVGVEVFGVCPIIANSAIGYKNYGESDNAFFCNSQKNVNITNAGGIFNNPKFAKSLQSEESKSLLSFYNWSGTIPSNLFEGLKSVTKGICCQFNDHGTGLLSHSEEETEIPLELFDNLDTNAPHNFSLLFNMCVNLKGKAPELWNMFPNSHAYDCFYRCANLSDTKNGWTSSAS